MYVQINADEIKFSLSFSPIFSVKIVLISDRSITRLFWRFNYHHVFRVSFLSRTNRVPLPHPPKEKKPFFVLHSVCDISCYKPTILRFFVYFTIVSFALYMLTSVFWARSFSIAKFRSFYSFKKSNNTWPGKRRQVVTPLIVAETRWFKSP